jgi:signal transduction histidine kinase
MAENKDSTLSREQVEYAQVIQSSGNGLLELIDEILDLSKIEAGKMDLDYSYVSFKQVMDDMRMLFEPWPAKKDYNSISKRIRIRSRRLKRIKCDSSRF